jgi:hypothetical protein
MSSNGRNKISLFGNKRFLRGFAPCPLLFHSPLLSVGNFPYHQLFLVHIDLYLITDPETSLLQPLPIEIKPGNIFAGIKITAEGY